MTSQPEAPVFLVVDVDVAKSLGGIIREELGLHRAVIAIDGIEVGDLDYVDVGKPMGASEVIPVTVKSLVFSLRSQSGIAASRSEPLAHAHRSTHFWSSWGALSACSSEPSSSSATLWTSRSVREIPDTAGLLVLFFAFLAIAGAVICLKKPWQGASLLLLSGAGCLIVINIFGAPVFFLTLLAAFSAIRGRRESQLATYAKARGRNAKPFRPLRLSVQ